MEVPTYRNQSIDFPSNKWIGFYIMGRSVMKELKFIGFYIADCTIDRIYLYDCMADRIFSFLQTMDFKII